MNLALGIEIEAGGHAVAGGAGANAGQRGALDPGAPADGPLGPVSDSDTRSFGANWRSQLDSLGVRQDRADKGGAAASTPASLLGGIAARAIAVQGAEPEEAAGGKARVPARGALDKVHETAQKKERKAQSAGSALGGSSALAMAGIPLPVAVLVRAPVPNSLRIAQLGPGPQDAANGVVARLPEPSAFAGANQRADVARMNAKAEPTTAAGANLAAEASAASGLATSGKKDVRDVTAQDQMAFAAGVPQTPAMAAKAAPVFSTRQQADASPAQDGLSKPAGSADPRAQGWATEVPGQGANQYSEAAAAASPDALRAAKAAGLGAKSADAAVQAASRTGRVQAGNAAEREKHLADAQPAGTGVEAVRFAGEASGARGAGNAVGVHGGLAANASASLSAHETFTALDAGANASSPSWIHAGAQRAEAGFQDPSLGWVGVRADLNAGGIHAALVPGSPEAAQALAGHLAGLSAHLATRHPGVQAVTVAAPEARVGSWGGGQGSGQGAYDGSNRGSGQNPQQGGTAQQQSGAARGDGSAPVVGAVATSAHSRGTVSTAGVAARGGAYISVVA